MCKRERGRKGEMHDFDSNKRMYKQDLSGLCENVYLFAFLVRI